MFLDEKGRCCGRKPLQYKQPTPHLFCFRCDREYSLNGEQRENWAWIWSDRDKVFVRRLPKLQKTFREYNRKTKHALCAQNNSEKQKFCENFTASSAGDFCHYNYEGFLVSGFCYYGMVD